MLGSTHGTPLVSVVLPEMPVVCFRQVVVLGRGIPDNHQFSYVGSGSQLNKPLNACAYARQLSVRPIGCDLPVRLCLQKPFLVDPFTACVAVIPVDIISAPGNDDDHFPAWITILLVALGHLL